MWTCTQSTFHISDPPQAVPHMERHRQWDSDRGTMRMRGALPLIAVWDDHESTNNAFRTGAQVRPLQSRPVAMILPGPAALCKTMCGAMTDYLSKQGPCYAVTSWWSALPWELRAANAVRAYFEYMPIRPASQSPEDRHRIYRQFQFGKRASLLMLDTRFTGRDPEQPSQPFNTSDMRYFISSRSLLGKEQRKWVRDNLLKAKDDRVTWKVLGQQVRCSRLPRDLLPNCVHFSAETLTILAERERILDTIEQHAIDNVVVLTGDVHSSFAMDVPREQSKAYEPETGVGYDPATGCGSLAVKIVCNSVTSLSANGPCNAVGFDNLFRTQNRNVKYVQSLYKSFRTQWRQSSLGAMDFDFLVNNISPDVMMRARKDPQSFRTQWQQSSLGAMDFDFLVKNISPDVMMKAQKDPQNRKTRGVTSEPGLSAPLPAKHSKRTKAEQVAEPTQLTKAQAKARPRLL
ncbi:hypothetical protein QJQ45_015432 [Haematococcus lacustris]|nr:hypothetical protein QJQ45_015432 [Haematococcus lacustris]